MAAEGVPHRDHETLYTIRQKKASFFSELFRDFFVSTFLERFVPRCGQNLFALPHMFTKFLLLFSAI